MGYGVNDLLDKAIKIANERQQIYKKIGKDKATTGAMDVIGKVLSDDAKKTIGYYKSLKEDIGDTEREEIDFGVYDKISFLFNQFHQMLSVPEILDVREFLSFSLSLEKQVYGLFVDVQGRMVKNEKDTETNAYKLLTQIMDNKKRQIEMLEKLLKRNF